MLVLYHLSIKLHILLLQVASSLGGPIGENVFSSIHPILGIRPDLRQILINLVEGADCNPASSQRQCR